MSASETTMTMTLPDGTTTGPFTAEDLKRATEALKKKAPMKDDPDFRKHNQKAYSVTAAERDAERRRQALTAERNVAQAETRMTMAELADWTARAEAAEADNARLRDELKEQIHIRQNCHLMPCAAPGNDSCECDRMYRAAVNTGKETK
jgi:hypothetical protein